VAKTLLLRFSTKALDKAIRTTTKIRDGLNAAIKAGNNASTNVDRLIEQEQRLASLRSQRRQVVGSALAASGRGGAAARLGVGGPGFFGRAAGALGRRPLSGTPSREAARGLAGLSALRSLAGGTLSSSAAFGASLLGGPAGAAAAVAVQAAALVKETLGPILEAQVERVRDEIIRDVRAELDATLRDMAFDPGGNTERQQLIRSQFAEQLKNEVATGADAAWSDMSARLSGMR